jgi:hypothetical protein
MNGESKMTEKTKETLLQDVGNVLGVERSVNDALVEVSKSIDRAIDSFGLTPNQELDLYTALMSVLETLALGVIGDDEDEKLEIIQ